jgi:hypothetical protein
MKYNTVLDVIGNTPHIRLSRLFPEQEVWLKLERQNVPIFGLTSPLRICQHFLSVSSPCNHCCANLVQGRLCFLLHPITTASSAQTLSLLRAHLPPPPS